MLPLQGIAVLLLCTASHAIPRHGRDTTDEILKVAIEPRTFEHIVNDIGAPPTDYRTMPPGTYTESISTGLVRIIVVNDPTPTTNKSCPAECDCSGIKDKKSPEYFQCLANSRCRPCREPAITASSAKSTATCPAYCDCNKIKDKQSPEYFQCLANINCQRCRVGGAPSLI
ncbi:hypothetical protein NXS19_008387 [Fusarium pseudograminearum]|nr:hypothetical protein NXS19_008387 [Fusarium pseudograminearum]